MSQEGQYWCHLQVLDKEHRANVNSVKSEHGKIQKRLVFVDRRTDLNMSPVIQSREGGWGDMKRHAKNSFKFVFFFSKNTPLLVKLFKLQNNTVFTK